MKSGALALALLAAANAATTVAAQLETASTSDQHKPAFHDAKFGRRRDDAIRDTSGATFRQIDDINLNIRPIIEELVKTDYFRYYKVDLSEELCPYVDETLGMCGNRACAVEPVENEDQIPPFWRTQYLGRLAEDSVSNAPMWAKRDGGGGGSGSGGSGAGGSGRPESCINPDESLPVYQLPQSASSSATSASRDYCYPEDESLDGPGVYVSLPDNPERFTGYGGPHAHKVWRSVYQENCFGYHGDSLMSLNPEDPGALSFSSSADAAAAAGVLHGQAGSLLSSVMMEPVRRDIHEVGGEAGDRAMNQDELCVEQRLFYRLLSGMHASISTHLCYAYLNKTTGEWSPNLECFMSRVGNHPERLSNMYFNYAVVSRAVAKLRNYIDGMHFASCETVDIDSRRMLLRLVQASQKTAPFFNETALFASPEFQALKDEFRSRVRKVNALMSCVGCERCRLWGKVQTAGYGTALKLLFELPERPEDDPVLTREVMSTFRRSELVALVNTFDRLTKSVMAVNYFRDQFRAGLEGVHTAPAVDEPPLKPKRKTPTLKESWDAEFGLFLEGLRFVLRTYVEMPKHLWTLFVYYSSIYWNRFVGLEPQQVRVDL